MSKHSRHVPYSLVMPTSPSSYSPRPTPSPPSHSPNLRETSSTKASPASSEFSIPTPSLPSCSPPPPTVKRTQGTGKPRKPHAEKPYGCTMMISRALEEVGTRGVDALRGKQGSMRGTSTTCSSPRTPAVYTPHIVKQT
ncbi:hypothetical protein CPC08DRAFT_768832 [Agrocybe pediades]|nr:hypothetical protein CPC08DRAFT_768832 [Agrocybe pediades]